MSQPKYIIFTASERLEFETLAQAQAYQQEHQSGWIWLPSAIAELERMWCCKGRE